MQYARFHVLKSVKWSSDELVKFWPIEGNAHCVVLPTQKFRKWYIPALSFPTPVACFDIFVGRKLPGELKISMNMRNGAFFNRIGSKGPKS